MEDDFEASSERAGTTPGAPVNDRRELGPTPYRHALLATKPRELDVALLAPRLPADARQIGLGQLVLILPVAAILVGFLYSLFRAKHPMFGAVVSGASGLAVIATFRAAVVAGMRAPKLRMVGGKLMLSRPGVSVAEGNGVIDVERGVHVDVRDTGVRFDNIEQARITIVGYAGRLSWTLLGLRRADALRGHIGQFLESQGVSIRARGEPLGGAVRVVLLKSGAIQLSWSLPDRINPTAWAIVAGVIAAGFAAWFRLSFGATIGVAAAVAAAILVVVPVWRPEQPFARRARLVISRDGWRLVQRIGWRREQHRATGALEATYVVDTDVPGGRRAIELRSDGKLVTTTGEGLTEPELRFIIERIRQATSSQDSPRLDPPNP